MRFIPRPEISATRCPVSLCPVNATRRTFGFEINSSPTTPPAPVTMFSTPGGRPAAFSNSIMRVAVSGVVLAGLWTTVLPATSAGPSLVPINVIGKFHGEIAAHTPIGCLSTMPYIVVSGSGTYEPRTVGPRRA